MDLHQQNDALYPGIQLDANVNIIPVDMFIRGAYLQGIQATLNQFDQVIQAPFQVDNESWRSIGHIQDLQARRAARQAEWQDEMEVYRQARQAEWQAEMEASRQARQIRQSRQNRQAELQVEMEASRQARKARKGRQTRQTS